MALQLRVKGDRKRQLRTQVLRFFNHPRLLQPGNVSWKRSPANYVIDRRTQCVTVVHCLHSARKINSCSKSYLYFAFVYQNLFSTSTLLLSESSQSLDLGVLNTEAWLYMRDNLFWQPPEHQSIENFGVQSWTERGNIVIPATLEVEAGGSQVQGTLSDLSENLCQNEQ